MALVYSDSSQPRPQRRVPSGHCSALPVPHDTLQFPVFRQVTTHRPSQTGLQLPTRSQTAVLSGPSFGAQSFTSLQE